MRTTKFPPEFNVKVDMKKVNNQVIKTWVTEELARILKSEDDVVTELVTNILDESRYVRLAKGFKLEAAFRKADIDFQPNIRELQISLTGFLDKDAATFCAALWKLCLSAQDSPHGVPKEILEAKKAELAQAKVSGSGVDARLYADSPRLMKTEHEKRPQRGKKLSASVNGILLA